MGGEIGGREGLGGWVGGWVGGWTYQAPPVDALAVSLVLQHFRGQVLYVWVEWMSGWVGGVVDRHDEIALAFYSLVTHPPIDSSTSFEPPRSPLPIYILPTHPPTSGVPQKVCAPPSTPCPVTCDLESPKSVRRMWPSASSRMFSGLRSLVWGGWVGGWVGD